MKFHFGFLNLFFCLFFSITTHACDVIDDVNQNIHLAHPAQRIISLAPDITEILFAIGAGQHVVGVMAGSDFPPLAKTLTQVGSYSGLDLESIIALHPDLIVVWSNTFSRQLNELKKLGIPIYTTQPQRLEDIPRTMKNLGCLANVTTGATQSAEKFSQGLAHLRARFRTAKPITVFYQIGDYALITINRSSWINQVIHLCGGRNVFANAYFISPEVSWEAVIAANPQVVMDSSSNDHWKQNWLQWQEVTAVKKQALFTLNPDWIERAGPRLLDGARQLCEALQLARTQVFDNKH